MPQRFAHVPLQRLVVRGHATDGSPDAPAAEICFMTVVRPLLRVLEMRETPRTLNVTRTFLRKSLPTVAASLGEAAKQPLQVDTTESGGLAWPAPLEVEACRGPLVK